jgi:PAS domain S-box-containing protein
MSNPDIFDLVHESVIVCDLDGRITLWNIGSQELYGWSRSEAVGRIARDLLITSGEPQMLADWDGEVRRTNADLNNVVVRIRKRIRRDENGTPIDIIELGAALTVPPSDPRVRRYRNLFHFVPVPLVELDRHKLAAKFKDMRTAGIKDLMLYFDANPGFFDYAINSISVLEVNRQALELFRTNDPGQLRGPATRIWSEAHATVKRSMAARFGGASSYSAEMKIRTFDGELRDVLYFADFPEAFSDDALGLACFVDITNRVKAQAKLQQLQSEFAHAARISMLGEFTASIAHEINQPLGAILTNAGSTLRWLGRAKPDLDELRTLATRTVIDARRAGDIIQRVRAMAVRGETEKVPIGLNDIVEESMAFVRPELARNGVETVLELATNLPDVMGDRVQLQQVIVNLVANAMHAMSDRPLRRLTVRTTQPEPNLLGAAVEDTGPGIAPENLDRLFGSFFTTKKSGMGIGLAICRSIIEGHGGRIEASNLPNGAGARFFFTLPTGAAWSASHTRV